jgi:hypothetical protein
MNISIPVVTTFDFIFIFIHVYFDSIFLILDPDIKFTVNVDLK